MALAWLWARLVPVVAVVAVAVCVAGVAFGSIDLHSVGQAWHLVTLTFTLCRRRGTYGTGLAPCGALGSRCRRGCFVWQALHSEASTFILCGRRGTWPSLCVASVALLALAWLWWRAWFPLSQLSSPLFVWQPGRLATSTFTLCGRCGRRRAYGTGLALVARLVRLSPLSSRLFVWQAWHLEVIDLHSVWQQAWRLAQRLSWRNCLGATVLAQLSWRNCLWPHMPHNSFTYNSLTHSSFTQSLFHQLHYSHTQLSHTQPSHTHTLAQKCLIELLMWNASHVQKTLQLNLTGMVE